MKSLDVANYMIHRFGSELALTNLKLNKLVYFAQVEALRGGSPLFDDDIQAWQYGPVEPEVYFAFSRYGAGIIPVPNGPYEENERMRTVVDRVAGELGRLTAFDLVRLSHMKDGAWEKAYSPDVRNPITNDLIMRSADIRRVSNVGRTLTDGIETVTRSWPNAFRLLEDS